MSLLPEPLHPAVVHFPIALTLVALLFEVLGRHPRLRALASGGLLLVVLAALGAIVAVLSGNLAHDAAVVPAAARDLVESHEGLGESVMWGLLALAAIRVVLAAKEWYEGWRPWAFILLLLVAAGAVGYNGHLGGKLVFDHGIGTAPSFERPATDRAPGD